MLVAVAAMAFTACSQDVNEVNNVERVTRYEFTANIADDTRSGFAEKEDGATAYKSEWHEGDEVKVFIDNYGAVTTDIDTEGNFALELTNAPEPFFMTVCAPAAAWTGKTSWTVPTEQTPLANSVDPKAHILRSNENILVSNGTPKEKIVMSHYASYGKMTVNGVEFKINKVEVSFNGGQVYTINAINVENNTFWFAISDSLIVSEFTVTAYGDNDSVVTKTVTIPENRELKFNWGRVSKFSVSGLEKPAVPEEPDTVMDSAKYYFDYNNYGGYDNWGYVVFEDEYLGTLVLNCTFSEGLYLDICEYTSAANALGVRFDVGYSYYNVVGGTPYLLYNNYYNTMTVDVVDGKYSISLDVKNDNGEKLEATYVGDIEGLVYPDLRTQLAKPNATATADGNVITISWNEVTGADEYYVFCYVGGLDAVTTTETSVTIEAAYSTKYDFLIRAVANDSNADYRTSDDYYFSVTTGRDPNVFADKMWTTLRWDGSRFVLNDASEYMLTQLYINASDRPNNNSLKLGTYTYDLDNRENPGSGKFGIRNFMNFTAEGKYLSSSSTMTVDFVDGAYKILIHTYSSAVSSYNDVTYGYIGLPEGWVAPSEGGDEPVDPTPDPEQPEQPDQPDQPGQPVEDFTNWVFDAHYNTSNRVVTLSGRNDDRVITLVTDELAFAKFYADSENYGDYFTNLTVDGVPTDDVTPTSYVQIKSSGVVINLVIKGVTYTGTSKSFSY